MKIKYSNGETDTAETLDDALAIIGAKYPDMTSTDCGDRTLVWANEQDADNDDGARAIAEVTQ